MRWIFNINDLVNCLETEDNIVLYGAGYWGKMLIDHIFSINRQHKVKGIVVTNKEGNDNSYREIPIYKAADFLKVEKAFVIIAVSELHQKSIEAVVQEYGTSYGCLTPAVCREIVKSKQHDIRKNVPYAHLDFLIPGFFKCGTTSLYQAFRAIGDIYLSEKKESLFFEWCDTVKEPEKFLIDNYFDNIREGQIVGMIEPTFFREAQRVYQIWGGDIKLIFLVRNPVDALFSQFKMCSRQGSETLEEGYKNRGGVFSEEIFDEWTGFEQYYDYSVWIQEYMRYYPRNQIHIVLFEEMIQKSREILNDVLKFVGSSNENKGQDLPWGNEGNYVMADIEGLRLMREYQYRLHEFQFYMEGDPVIKTEKYNTLRRFRKLVEGTDKIYGIKMNKVQRRRTEDYYFDSVRRLEKIVDRDLSKIWF